MQDNMFYDSKETSVVFLANFDSLLFFCPRGTLFSKSMLLLVNYYGGTSALARLLVSHSDLAKRYHYVTPLQHHG